MRSEFENQSELSEFQEPFREIEMLRRLGLREDEISYLVWLKSKETRKAHWRD
jgi:hypothetical protein